MKIKIFILNAILLAGTGISAQINSPFIGDWEGKLPVGAGLKIVFHIKPDGSGTVDSPDQGAYGISCAPSITSANTISIKMPAFNASFSGTLQNDSTIAGEFVQGNSLTLTLNRKSIAKTAVINRSTVYDEKEVTLEVTGATLSGTLFEPINQKKKIAVLIIAGSGPTDRNGNSAIAGQNNSLLMIADSLATHGIASLRFDKRGIAKSKLSPSTSLANVTINDMASDAKQLCEWLSKQGYKDIYIAGHSEGSLIALMIANDVKPAGVISIAGAGRKASDILKEQLSPQLTPQLFASFSTGIDSLEKGFDVKNTDPQLMGLLNPSVQTYMKSWLKLNPITLASSLKSPLLILQGTSDLQVKEIDAQRLHNASKKSKLVLIAGMNHILKVVGNDKALNQRSYGDPSLPLSGELVTSMTDFIQHKSN